MKYLFLGLFALATLSGFAQDLSWKQHEKLGDELMAQGQYANAADNYELAWEQRPSKPSLLAKAADAYRQFRHYQKAADCYEPLLGNKNFPLTAWHYGRCLKQTGQYQTARVHLQNFLDTYEGKDQAILLPLVREELRGCGLAQEWSKQKSSASLQALTELNTKAADFAPLPFADDILYFSSTRKGVARIFRSQRTQGQFGSVVEPNLPRGPAGHFCHGSFAPNNERFYFTVCATEENWRGIHTPCELYVTMREANGWTTPQNMRDYVKMDGTTVTHPYVVHQGDTEIVYFSSDRSGGRGGMDIWFMTRQIVGRDIDFTYPLNAGPAVNTTGDEVSPFYDTEAGELYFSSNGRINAGGLDVFRIRGAQQRWEDAANLGPAVNSSADDYHYFPNPAGTGAFLVSNRSWGREKKATTDDDLYYLPSGQAPMAAGTVSGVVLDQQTGAALREVEVTIYEKVDLGTKRLLQSTISQNGKYSFPILPEREFWIESTKAGYTKTGFEFNTYEFDGTDPGRPIYLTAQATAERPQTPATQPKSPSSRSTSGEPPSTPPRPTPPAVTEESPPPPPTKLVARDDGRMSEPSDRRPKVATETSERSTYTNSRFKRDGVTTDAPKREGIYYKVQLSVVIDYDAGGLAFQKMRAHGDLHTEYIIEKGWTRVLLADFDTLEEARQMMDRARLAGFPEAFIVRYVDGFRKN
ncbi:MAG: hypothetical protein AAFW73_08680 [Bacteroidota bacterium]